MREEREEYNRQYYEKYNERLKEQQASYRKEYVVYSHEVRGQRILIENKPLQVEMCQICGKLESSSYHHWDDEHPERGLWLCAHCHRMSDRIELGYDERYIRLKKTFDGTVPIYKELRDERRERITKHLKHLYWEKEMSLREIGEMFDVSRFAIAGWMDKEGVPRRSIAEAQILKRR